MSRPRELWVFVVRGAGDEQDDRAHWVDIGRISQMIVRGRAVVHRAPATEADGE